MKNRIQLIVPVLMLIMLSGPMVESLMAQDKIVINLNIRLELGRRSKDCRGLGICDISFGLNSNALARIIPKSDILQVEFPMEFVKNNPHQFENDIFILEEDLEISDETSRELGSTRPLLIPKGKYELESTEYSLVINIPQK